MNSSKRKGLGRGLSALFGDEKPKQKSLEKKLLEIKPVRIILYIIIEYIKLINYLIKNL